MKKANKLIDAKYHFLSDDEKDMINDIIEIICHNHENDSWWKVETGIKAWVSKRLSMMLADDALIEETN